MSYGAGPSTTIAWSATQTDGYSETPQTFGCISDALAKSSVKPKDGALAA